jgi:hypothetical protein
MSTTRAIHRSGFFNYASCGWNNNENCHEYVDCMLLLNLDYDTYNRGSQLATFHDSDRCVVGATLDAIYELGRQLVGWAGEDVIMDLCY